jgi:hypothetical protein
MPTIAAMFWRSLLLLPFAGLLGIAYLSCLVLPVCVVLLVEDSQWWWAAGTAAAWITSLAIAIWWSRQKSDAHAVTSVMI